MITIYRILTYVLLVFGFLLGLLTLASLMAALANVAALLPAFLCGATVIYIYASLFFLHNGILGKRSCKPSLYDWIRVNGYVALFLGSMFIFQSIYFRGNNELNEQLQVQMDAMSEQMESGKVPDLQVIIDWALNFMLASGLILVTHILLGFSLLKKYAHVFGRPAI